MLESFHLPQFARSCLLNDTDIIGGLPEPQVDTPGIRLLFLPIDSNPLADQFALTQSELGQSAKLLNLIHLDFSLRTHGLITDFQMVRLLGSHPEAMHLQMPEDELFQTWQSLLNVYSPFKETLITGVVMASQEKIQTLLQETIDMHGLGLRSVLLKVEGLWGIHVVKYPPLSNPFGCR